MQRWFPLACFLLSCGPAPAPQSARRAVPPQHPTLSERLRSPRWQERAAAVQTLGKPGGVSLSTVLKTLRSDRHRGVRLACVLTLGRARGPRVVTALLAVLEKGGPLVQLAAIKALRRRRTPRAATRLFQLALKGPKSLRRPAAEALVSLNAAAVPVLLSALHSDDPARGSDLAVELLLLLQPVVLAPLGRELRAGRSPVAVAGILVKLGPRGVATAMQAYSSKVSGVRSAILHALGSVNKAQIIPLLVRAIASEQHPLTAMASGALAGITDPKALPRLVQLLTGPLPKVDAKRRPQLRSAAAQALAEQGRRGVGSLTKALGSTDPEIRAAVAVGLQSGKRQLHLDLALRAAQDQNEGVVVAALRALGQLPDEKGLKVLTKTVLGNKVRLAVAAADALSLLSISGLRDGAVAVLGQALKRRRAVNVQIAAAKALTLYSGNDVRDLLLRALKTRRTRVFVAVARALGEFAAASKKTFPALLRYLQRARRRPAPRILAVIAALTKIRDRQALPMLLKLTRDQRKAISTAARYAITLIKETP